MRETWLASSLLWLAGVGLRMTILAVPPVISLIQSDLRLSGTEIGILSGLPMILFAIAALPGSLLIARFGAVPTLVTGLLVAGIASSLRGAILDVIALYAATVVMSAGIAVMQPALPPLVRRWLPGRVGFGTAVYTNGLLVGETLVVMLTIPLVLPLVDGSWRWALALWGLPLVLIAILIATRRRRRRWRRLRPRAGRSWWPDWSNKLIWQGGLLIGSINSAFFCSNAFLPGHLTSAGRPDLIVATLTALNFGPIPASFALLALAGRLERRAWPFVLCGGLMLLCVAGMAMTASPWTVLYAGVLGFVGAVVLTLGLTLPPLLTAPSEVARMSAAMFTVSYSEALLVSVVSGAAWDVSGSPRFAFLPIAISVLPLLFVPAKIGFHRPLRAAAAS